MEILRLLLQSEISDDDRESKSLDRRPGGWGYTHGAPMTWSALFEGEIRGRPFQLSYVSLVINQGKKMLMISKALQEEAALQWRSLLVGYVGSMRLRFESIEGFFKRDWQVSSTDGVILEIQ